MSAAALKIQIQKVTKAFAPEAHAVPAVVDFDLDIAEREFLCILGPSSSPTRSARRCTWPTAWG